MDAILALDEGAGSAQPLNKAKADRLGRIIFNICTIRDSQIMALSEG